MTSKLYKSIKNEYFCAINWKYYFTKNKTRIVWPKFKLLPIIITSYAYFNYHKDFEHFPSQMHFSLWASCIFDRHKCVTSCALCHRYFTCISLCLSAICPGVFNSHYHLIHDRAYVYIYQTTTRSRKPIFNNASIYLYLVFHFLFCIIDHVDVAFLLRSGCMLTGLLYFFFCLI